MPRSRRPRPCADRVPVGRPGRRRTRMSTELNLGPGFSAGHQPVSRPHRRARPRQIRLRPKPARAPREQNRSHRWLAIGAIRSRLPPPRRMGQTDRGDAHSGPIHQDPNLGQVRRHERLCLPGVADEHGSSVCPRSWRILDESSERGFVTGGERDGCLQHSVCRR